MLSPIPLLSTSILLLISIILITTILLISFANPTKATSINSDLNVKVEAVLALSLVNCDSTNPSTLKVDITPSSAGTFKSNCQTVTVDTNAPGYTLTAKSSSTTLNYLNPTTISPTPTIASTTAQYTNPDILNANSWGFAAQDRLNFPNTYDITNANHDSRPFAALPAVDTTIYQADTFPAEETDHTFFYAAKLTPTVLAGSYATTITYTGISAEVPMPITHCGTVDDECIIFSIYTDDGTYSIPTSGRVAESYDHAYDWLVYVDDVLTTACNTNDIIGYCKGVGANNSTGIALTGLSDGTHQIRIIPYGNIGFNASAGSIAGWGNAFGHMSNTSGANATTNKEKMISIDAPLTTMTFAPKASESTTNATYMLAFTFHNCTNMTTTSIIKNTYTLPSTITHLSNFMSWHHYGNIHITAPIDLSLMRNFFSSNNSIEVFPSFLFNTHGANYSMTRTVDLSPVSGWFSGNTSITSLSHFLRDTHNGNTLLTSPVDLSPVSGWFNDNNSIQTMTYFLALTHSDNSSLVSAINLSPISNWFSANNSMTDLSYFFSETHSGNTQLTTPINFLPISGWFESNNSITNMYNFLSYTFRENNAMTKTIDLAPFSDWFYENESITNFGYFLYNIHSRNTELTEPISLTPLTNWFYHNETVTVLSTFLQSAHLGDTSLTKPVDLAPIANWFNDNSSINNIGNFLRSTHAGNLVLTTPIDLTPLSGWFSDNRTMDTLISFMYETHSNNPNLVLNGQALLPDWIKTMRDGSGTPIWDVGTSVTVGDTTTITYSFYQTFYRTTGTASTTDTAEIEFEDGTTLSSLGEPSANRRTYTNRNGLTNLLQNSNWK